MLCQLWVGWRTIKEEQVEWGWGPLGRFGGGSVEAEFWLAESGAALASADGGVLHVQGQEQRASGLGNASLSKVTTVEPTGGPQTHRVPELEASQLGL